jgi:hypothetical protein
MVGTQEARELGFRWQTQSRERFKDGEIYGVIPESYLYHLANGALTDELKNIIRVYIVKIGALIVGYLSERDIECWLA